jgi:preprotein translocase subunit SecG
MDLLISLLTFVEVLVCLLLILIVLMQRPRQEGLGASFGEGVTSQVWGAQTTNVLQKGTGWLGAALLFTSVALAYCISQSNAGNGSDTLFKAKKEAETAPAKTAEATPAAAPASSQTKIQPGGTVTVKPGPAAPAAASKPVEVPKTDAPVAPKSTEASKAAPATPPAPKPAPAPASTGNDATPKPTPAPATAPAAK